MYFFVPLNSFKLLFLLIKKLLFKSLLLLSKLIVLSLLYPLVKFLLNELINGSLLILLIFDILLAKISSFLELLNRPEVVLIP